MAADKLVDSTQLDTDLTSVANAIRTKGGTSAALAFPAEFVSAIEAIETGGGGGNGEYKKLYTLTLAEAVHAVQVDFDPLWVSYDILNVVIQIPTPYNDWVYVAYNATSSSSFAKRDVRKLKYIIIKDGDSSEKWRLGTFNSAPAIPNNNSAFPTFAYFYMYTESVNFPVGTKFEVYGGFLDESI